jgi:coenzyme PQQ precursor peptide PqqA
MQWLTPNLTNMRFGFEFTMYIAARQVHEGRLARPFFSGRRLARRQRSKALLRRGDPSAIPPDTPESATTRYVDSSSCSSSLRCSDWSNKPVGLIVCRFAEFARQREKSCTLQKADAISFIKP